MEKWKNSIDKERDVERRKHEMELVEVRASVANATEQALKRM